MDPGEEAAGAPPLADGSLPADGLAGPVWYVLQYNSTRFRALSGIDTQYDIFIYIEY
jgi:hypothetical protein